MARTREKRQKEKEMGHNKKKKEEKRPTELSSKPSQSFVFLAGREIPPDRASLLTPIAGGMPPNEYVRAYTDELDSL